VFSGSPAPNDAPDPQRSNPSGTSFPFNRGVLAIAEIQFSYPELGGLEEPGAGAPLGHTYKIGAWYDSRQFDDLQIDNTGQSLASASSSGVPRQHRGSYSIYAVADQMVWRDAANPNRSISVFGRAMGTPQADRNLIDYSANGGVVYHAPFTRRPDDTVGLGFGYAHVSNRAAALDRDTALVNFASGVDGYSAIRSSETFIEATYQYQVFSWWQLQPDAQYVNHPGGGIANPVQPTQRVKNELVLGLRTNVLF
jgi:porin